MPEPAISTSTTQVPAKPRQDEGKRSFFNSAYADIVGAILTIGSGIGAAYVIINKNFFGNFDEESPLKSVERRNERLKNLSHGDKTHYSTEVAKVNHAYNAEVKEELKALNVRGILDKWRALRSHQKVEAAIALSAVSAVMLGLITNFLGNREIAKNQEDIKRRLDERENQVQR